MKNNNDCIVFFSSLEWNTQRQVVHEYCEYLSKKQKILFIENTGVRSLKLKDSLRVGRAFKNFFKLKRLFYDVDKNITIFRPIFIPFFQYSKVMAFINSILINFFILNWIKLKNIKNFNCVSFLPTPIVQMVIKTLKPSKLVYYCIDNLAIKSSNYIEFKKYENKFIKISDLIICTSKILENNAKKISSKVLHVPSGVNYNKLNESKNSLNISENLFFENLTGKIFGYIGAVRDIIDYEFIYNLSKKIDNSYFVFIGPIITEPPSYIKKQNNFFFLGSKSHDLIASYINRFNICLIPYIKNEFTDAIYPTKINEYLSLGKPIISTRTYEMENFSRENSRIINFVNFEENLNEVTDEIISITHKREALRRKIAKENDWTKRFEKINLAEEKFYQIKKSEDWKVFFERKISQKIFKPIQILSIVLLTLIFLYSDFLKFTLGEKLIIQSKNIESNTLVIFSGYGGSNYHNFEYRKRIQDAEKILKEFDIKNIIIYGRYKTISENRIMSSLLIDKGYNQNIIFIEDKFKNTKQNLDYTKKQIEILNEENFLFVSSPILYKRINLLWKKNIQNIEIFFPTTHTTEKILKQKKLHEVNLRSILYEYAAITYNFIRGWI